MKNKGLLGLKIKESDVFSWLKGLKTMLEKHLICFKGQLSCEEWEQCEEELCLFRLNIDRDLDSWTWAQTIKHVCNYMINNDSFHFFNLINEIQNDCEDVISILRYNDVFMRECDFERYVDYITPIIEEFKELSIYFSTKHPESKNVNNKKFGVGLLTNKAIDKIVEYINKSDIVEINSTDLFQMVIEADFAKLYVPKYKTKTQWIIRHLKQNYYDLDWYKAACKSIGKTINDVDKTNVGDPDWVDYFPK